MRQLSPGFYRACFFTKPGFLPSCVFAKPAFESYCKNGFSQSLTPAQSSKQSAWERRTYLLRINRLLINSTKPLMWLNSTKPQVQTFLEIHFSWWFVNLKPRGQRHRASTDYWAGTHFFGNSSFLGNAPPAQITGRKIPSCRKLFLSKTTRTKTCVSQIFVIDKAVLGESYRDSPGRLLIIIIAKFHLTGRQGMPLLLKTQA